jgi:tripartite-type tricarboxylate transporter receptor subunit TctC
MRDWWPGLLVSLACWNGFARAEVSFPAKPVRFVVTSPPGGANDTLNRALGAKLTEFIGQPVVIDNRPGASGFVAAEIVAKAPAPPRHGVVQAHAVESMVPPPERRPPDDTR